MKYISVMYMLYKVKFTFFYTYDMGENVSNTCHVVVVKFDHAVAYHYVISLNGNCINRK